LTHPHIKQPGKHGGILVDEITSFGSSGSRATVGYQPKVTPNQRGIPVCKWFSPWDDPQKIANQQEKPCKK